jgi:hypothetical protein
MPAELSAWLSATKALLSAYPWVFFVIAGVVLVVERRGALWQRAKNLGGRVRGWFADRPKVAMPRIGLSVWLLVAMGVVSMAPWKGCDLPSIPSWPSTPTVSPEKATAVTYVYEKDKTAIPVQVLVGINRLNREKKVVASHFEEDATDGDEQVPDQYKVPLKAAQEAGLPALVVTAGDKVLKVVKDPKTEAEVIGAVQ